MTFKRVVDNSSICANENEHKPPIGGPMSTTVLHQGPTNIMLRRSYLGKKTAGFCLHTNRPRSVVPPPLELLYRSKKNVLFLGAGLNPHQVRTGYEGTQPHNKQLSGQSG